MPVHQRDGPDRAHVATDNVGNGYVQITLDYNILVHVRRRPPWGTGVVTQCVVDSPGRKCPCPRPAISARDNDVLRKYIAQCSRGPRIILAKLRCFGSGQISCSASTRPRWTRSPATAPRVAVPLRSFPARAIRTAHSRFIAERRRARHHMSADGAAHEQLPIVAVIVAARRPACSTMTSRRREPGSSRASRH